MMEAPELRENMVLVYTAGPITAGSPSERYRNCMRAWHYAMRLWKKGIGVICPQMNTFFMDNEEIPYNTFMQADYQMIVKACGAVLLLPGWEDSKGSCMEKALAESRGIPVFKYTELEKLYDYFEVEDAVHSS